MSRMEIEPQADGGFYVKSALEFMDEKDYVEWAEALLRVKRNLALVGETGCGKDTLFNALAQGNRWRVYAVSMSGDVNRYTMVVCPEQKAEAGGTTLSYREMPVVKALRYANIHPQETVILYFPEFNWAAQDVSVVLNPLTDDTERLPVPELQEVIPRPKNLYIVVSMNPADRIGYGGANLMNRAQMRRFGTINMDYMSKFRELELLRRIAPEPAHEETLKKFLDIAQATRSGYKQGVYHATIDTGSLKMAAGLLTEGLDPEKIMLTLAALFPSEQQGMIMELWKGTGKVLRT